MNPTLNHAFGIRVALAVAVTIGNAPGIIVDGIRDSVGYGAPLAVQSTQTTWGNDNFLANLHAVRSASSTIHLMIDGRASSGNTILLFVDSKPGGNNFIPNNLITSGGEESHINYLGSSPTSGLTFESGFSPDYAIRIYGNGTDAHVNLYNFASHSRTYLGNSGSTTVAGGVVSSMRTSWSNLTGAQQDHATGVEIAFNTTLLGVPSGSQMVKFMAVLATGDSLYGSNQVLASRTSTTADIGNGANGTVGFPNLNFQTEEGIQTAQLLIDGTDFDADGIPDVDDLDDDNDGLLDAVETDTGVFLNASDTGTDPLNSDTDGDGLSDFAEVSTHSTNPVLVDTDADGLNDRVEIEIHFSNPLLKDTDGDGFEDLFEVNTGFNPALATSSPDSLSSIRTAVEFRFNASNGVSYRIEVSSDLLEWTTIETDIIGQGGVVVRFFSTENQPKRFFRARRN